MWSFWQTYFKNTDVPGYANLKDGIPLVLGMIFGTSVAGEITAFRFYKAAGEGGANHFGRIYEWSTGNLVAWTDRSDDSSCAGGRWVTIPLAAPFRTAVGVKYTLALDAVMSYAKSENYYTTVPATRNSIISYGSVYGTGVGARPTSGEQGSACYWVDGKCTGSTST